jgi:DNA-binding CsgD family transcriptional regulator
VRVAHGGSGTLLLIGGPPGIGKSALLGEARRMAKGAGMGELVARGGEIERAQPYGVVRQLFEARLLRSSATEREELLAGAAQLALPAILGEEPTPTAAGEPAFAILHGLYWLTVNLAAQRPLVLAIDDAHWADTPSVRFLDYLGRRLDGLGVLVIACMRPDESVEVAALRPSARVVELAPLSRDGVARVVDELPGDAADTLHRVTGGNPLLLLQLMGALQAEGVTPSAAQIGRLRPRAIADSILLRLGRLPAECSRLAFAVAVLGASADLRHAAVVAELDVSAAAGAADMLAAAQIVNAGQPLEYVHPVVHTAIYEELPRSRRAELHGRAAAVLRAAAAPAEQVASHLLAAHPAGDPAAAGILRQAARLAMRGGAPAAAVELLRRAHAEPPAPADHAQVLGELGEAELQLARHEAASEHLSAAVAVADDPVAAARWMPALARAMLESQGAEAALAMLDEAIDAVARLDRDVALQLEGERASVGQLRIGLAPGALERLRRVTVAERVTDGKTLGERLVLASEAQRCWFACEPAEVAVRTARRALADGTLLAETAAEAIPFSQAVYTLILADDVDVVHAELDAALRSARERGSIVGFATVSTSLSCLAFRAGRLADAEADAMQALEALRPLDATPLLDMVASFAVRYLVESLVEQGELTGADALLAEYGFDGPLADLVPLNRLLYSRGVLRLAQGRAADALDDMLTMGRRDAHAGVDNPALPWRVGAALAQLSLGEREQARRHAEDYAALAERWGTASARGVAARALGLVHDGEERLARLEESVALLERSPARLELARSLIALGAALRTRGQRSDARATLERGADLARRCGSPVLAEQAAEGLAALGLRPRRLMFSGAESLTASERRVAAMAGEGLSNKQIAEALFVTPKTVENHLGRVYRKLAIGSRAELTDALGRAA